MEIPVLILAGGYGTRLKPFSLHLPKPMVPFANRPILEHMIRLLKQNGFTAITALLLYRPEKITAYFKEGERLGVQLDYHVALNDFGTAGVVQRISDRLNSTFVVVNGDIITDAPIKELVAFHKEKQALATIMLAKVPDPLPFGIAVLDEDSRIQEFVEKPPPSELISDLINAGVYVLEPEVLQQVPHNQPFFFAMDLFPLLVKKGLPIYGYVHSGYWQDIGDLRQYLLCHHEYLKGKFQLPDLPLQNNRLNRGKDVEIAANVHVEGTVLVGDRCRVEEGARIVRSVLGSDVRVASGAEICDSVVWSDVEIGTGARVVSDVIAAGTEVGNHVYFDDNVFVGEGCQIGDLSNLKSNVKIWPGKRIEPGSTVTSSLVWGDRWLKDLFTGSTITGIINQEVSPEFGAKLGAAFGAFLGKGVTVLVSWDGSPSARMINRAIICGLMSTGVHIGDLRVVPLPLLRYALQTGSEKGGVHVRQSRERENLLEILFLQDNGQDLSAHQAKSVERLFIQEDFNRAEHFEIGKLSFPVRAIESYQERYLQHLAASEIARARFKIVVDYSFGSAGLIFPSILGSLDCEVVALNAYLDTRHTPRSWADFRYALLQLGNIAVSLKADAGFLIDPGAERIFVVDEEGHFIKNEYLLVLVTRLFLQSNPHATIGLPPSAPRVLEELAAKWDSQIVPTCIDLRSIAETIHHTHLSFIGDGEGRFVFSQFHFASDAMFAIGKILELLARNHLHLRELQQEIPPPIITKKQIPCARDSIGEILRKLAQTNRDRVQTSMSGVKLIFSDGWLLITPNSQNPALDLFCEADSREKVEQVLERYVQKIEKLKARIQRHP